MRRVLFPGLIAIVASLAACASAGDQASPPSVDATLETSPGDAPPSEAASEGAVDAADADAADAGGESLVGTDVPAQRVGMFYLVWHAPAATAMRTIASKGSSPLTVEDVIRSDGAAQLSDVLDKWGVAGDAMSFYYNARPKLGFYCIYRARTGEPGVVPDCPNIETTLATHAQQLIDAGIDHVVIDATNLTGLDSAGQVLQLRPTEVLFEEWAKLRAAGKKTPQIAVWHAIPSGSTQWTGYQKLYSDPKYDGLVLHDEKSGKKVFFVVDPPDAGRVPDPTVLASIASNGGKNDVVVQKMWTLAKSDASVDRWAFMSWCQDAGHVTTSVVGAPACTQPWTPKSTLGSAIAVAPSFQTGYGSLPFGAAGKLRGLTFQRQWATAFAHRPDWVFISGWNEFISQPQSNPYTGDAFAKSVGLERDANGGRLFVDTFGADLGRDIEPTDDYGSLYYDLTKACVSLYRSGATSCSASSNPCCDPSATDVWTNVWALENGTAHDTLLTTSTTERDAVTKAGFREICSRYGTPSVFCVKSDEPLTPSGPFVAFGKAVAGSKPLHRCLTGSAHFYSLDPACEGQKTESVLAWLAQKPTGETPRRATRCYRPTTGEHFVAVGFGCPAGTNDEGLLGYVH